MSGPDRVLGGLSGVARRVLSIPIFFKVLGIGALVAVIFGSTTLYLTDSSTSVIHLQLLERKTSAGAHSLASNLERPVVTGDLFTVKQMLERTRRTGRDIRYIVVRDRRGRVIAHTFKRAVPTDLSETPSNAPDGWGKVWVLGSESGRIFDITVPILEGRAGTVQMGSTDQMLILQNRILTRLILGALAFSGAVGISLAFLLTHFLTRPIRHLQEVAQRIREGNFSARSKVFAADEIGSLAATINHMAESLEDYREEVQEKEAARAALIHRIVQVQEDERKHVARELHDQLGQSLSKSLLTFEAMREEGKISDPRYTEVEAEIRGLIDEVRLLASDIRPAVLDDYGLDSALDRYLTDVSKRLEIPIEYKSVFPPESGRLPSHIEVTLYRIAQEAITNVIRHARPSRASVVLLRRDSEVTLVIEDDGDGFDTSALEESDLSLGLLGMKERAALLAGEVEIQSRPGKGTEVLVTIPLGEDER